MYSQNKIGQLAKAILTDLAEKHKPSSDYKTSGRVMADKIFNALRGSHNFKIDRVLISGSMGKGTALGDHFSPDFDLIVFVNDEYPPFETLLLNFSRILFSAKLPGYRLQEITKFSVQFSVDIDGRCVDFDLLPATNFVKRKGCIKRMKKAQANAALQEISKEYEFSGTSGYSFSSCLAELTVLFLRLRPQWIISTIRLAKLWDKSIRFGQNVHISGRSYIIELLVVKACTRKRKQEVHHGFKCFLQLMCNLNDVSCIFGHNYPKQAIPEEILIQRPLILDPVNFCNNLGLNLTRHRDVIPTYMTWAEETLRRINNPIYLENPDRLFNFN